MRDIAGDHRQELVLAAIVEAEPEAEAVRQRHLLLHRLRRVDGGRALVLDHVARHEMPAVRGGVEDDVVRPALDAALQRRLQRLVGGVAGVEGEVVAEEDEALRPVAQQRHQLRQRLDVLAVDLDQLQRRRAGRQLGGDRGMHRLDQRALAHAARAPEERVVGRQAGGEAARCSRAACRASGRCP